MKLLRMPVGMIPREITPTRGPIVRGVTEGIDGTVQTVESPYGLVGLSLQFPPMLGPTARAYSRLRAALHGGANALAVPYFDPDEPLLKDLGFDVSKIAQQAGVPWSNGKPWSNGQLWGVALPKLAVAAAADVGTSVVKITVTPWNGNFDVAYFGFVGHFALYAVKWVEISGSTATVSIWPPLRKAVTAADIVTTRPVIAMRLISESGATGTRTLNALKRSPRHGRSA